MTFLQLIGGYNFYSRGVQEFIYGSTVKVFIVLIFLNVLARFHQQNCLQVSQLKPRKMLRFNNVIPSNAPISILVDEPIDVDLTPALHTAIPPASDMKVDEFNVSHSSIAMRCHEVANVR